MDRQQEFVLRTLEERDIRFVRLWFTDVLGTLKSVSVAPAELEAAFEEGIGFDGSAIEGFARVYESDMVAMPDPTTFQVFPFEGGTSGEAARMFCDIAMPDGSPSWADPRHVLRRMLSRAAESGFTCYVHPEIEFYLLKNLPGDGSPPEAADSGGYFDQSSHDAAPHFRRNAIETLESMGISVEFSHHELADGDRLLLCTDGLTDLVDDEELARALDAHPEPADACRALVDLALDRGGKDNVTVIVGRYEFVDGGADA